MNFVVIIPARYASTRFPGKPLALLGDKPVIIHTVEQASKGCDLVVVATDDQRIYDCVTEHGYRAVMTRADHKSGTDRVYEALQIIEEMDGQTPDVVINVQGDEPFVSPEQIQTLMECFEEDPGLEIATLIQPFDNQRPIEELQDPNLVKVVKDDAGYAIYFSRSVIPYVRGNEPEDWPFVAEFFTHVGIYAYSASALGEITSLPRSPLERAESLEQLRWLQNGYKIKVALTDHRNIGIDTPEDLAAASAININGHE